MGYFFDLRDANVLGWLTSSGANPTKFDDDDVAHLLESIDSEGERTLVSSDPAWRDEMIKQARRLRANYSAGRQSALPLVLAALRDAFSGFPFYAMAVGGERDFDALQSFVERHAVSRNNPGMFLCPRDRRQFAQWFNTLDIFSPFPALTASIASRRSWPGFVFWTSTGLTFFSALEDGEKLMHNLESQPKERGWRNSYNPVEAELRAEMLRVFGDQVGQRRANHHERDARQPRLLQLSDLHFGSAAARRRRTYLMRSIEATVEEESISQVVITGDLMDNPTEEAASDFFDFRDRLRQMMGKEPIIIPGNHDSKHLGNLPSNFREQAKLRCGDVIVDQELETIFLCFDSSRDADFARGRVTADQRMYVATRLRQELADLPRAKRFLRVALLHHHPFSFHIPPRGFWRLLSKIGLSEENFLRMEDGEDFVRWCARQGVPLILHGHKHVANHARGTVEVNSEDRGVDAIGCGSSTGKDDYPLSFNVLSWEPRDSRWIVSFFADPGDGSGFQSQRLKVTEVQVPTNP